MIVRDSLSELIVADTYWLFASNRVVYHTDIKVLWPHILGFERLCFQLDDQTVGGLDSGHLDMFAFDIASAKIEHIEITQACEGIERGRHHALARGVARSQVFRTLENSSAQPTSGR